MFEKASFAHCSKIGGKNSARCDWDLLNWHYLVYTLYQALRGNHKIKFRGFLQS